MMLYLIFEVLYFELASLSNITNLRKRLDRKKNPHQFSWERNGEFHYFAGTKAKLICVLNNLCTQFSQVW